MSALDPADSALLQRSTGGDLAGDPAYLTAVVAAWNGSHESSMNADRGIFDHLIGSPHVVWAGSTPAGRAAVVVQESYLRWHANIQLDREGPALLTGYVGPGPGGRPQVLTDTYDAPGAPAMQGFFVGPARTVLVVLEHGQPVQVSFRRIYADDGHVARDWQPVNFQDGAAVLLRPADATVEQVRLRDGSRDGLDIGNVPGMDVPRAQEPTVQLLPWGDSEQVWLIGPNPPRDCGDRTPTGTFASDVFDQALSGFVPDTWPDVQSSGDGHWFACGTTPDGSRLLVGERVLDTDPSHVYAVLRSPSGQIQVAARPVDASDRVPVLVPLPRGQGWFVAWYGAVIRYRPMGASAWQELGSNAALVPPGGGTVEFTRPGSAGVVFHLGPLR